jgi:hypothetical protein
MAPLLKTRLILLLEKKYIGSTILQKLMILFVPLIDMAFGIAIYFPNKKPV